METSIVNNVLFRHNYLHLPPPSPHNLSSDLLFRTPNPNGSLKNHYNVIEVEAAQAHIHVSTHIEMVKDGSSSTLNGPSPSSSRIWYEAIASPLQV